MTDYKPVIKPDFENMGDPDPLRQIPPKAPKKSEIKRQQHLRTVREERQELTSSLWVASYP
jgi:hypothetical protein